MLYRDATVQDLPAIVALLADDALGAGREELSDPLPQAYHEAVAAIEADPNNRVLVLVEDTTVVGTLQLTLIPNLSHRGSWRAQIEGVRVAASHRGRGLGRRLIEQAIEIAREAGCLLVQLTTDRAREDALDFYRSLGFEPTHHGMKRKLR
jgi:ribosomal protein S18 acetylase RimI-like enzyme